MTRPTRVIPKRDKSIESERATTLHLFGTVTNGDVAEAIQASTKKEIDRRDIQVPDIHTLGSFTVQIKLHQEVSAEVNIEVTS